ncbi:QRFP-like peptide receptor [Gigantopelta aegis]|uniref:QRFP-like peptide receptor n=1 Tax=Gigantopelta aegis TaxID=1735272 RepID=UPI001B88DD68|nr:QRFP-like peptide receptor [Gigantopelta aegis]
MNDTTCVPGATVASVTINVSTFLYPGKTRVVHEDWEIALKIIFYIIAFLVDVVGNSIVILIIGLNRKMRTTTNVLILNLAVSDLLVGIFCMWIHVGNQITTEWPFGQIGCKINVFIQVLVLISSVCTLTIISVERFIAVVFPFKAKWSPTATGVVIACIWIVAFSVACPQLVVRQLFEIQWKDRHQVWCQQVWPNVYKDAQCNIYQPSKIAYYIIQGILMFFFPVAIMIGAYTIIVVKLVVRKAPGSHIISTAHAQEKAKRKIIKMMITVVVVFVLCWTPQQVLLFWNTFKPKGTKLESYMDVVSYIALYVAFLNSAINPILYGGFNENFRRGFSDAFRCLLIKRHNQVVPDSTLQHWTTKRTVHEPVNHHLRTVQEGTKVESVPSTSAYPNRAIAHCESQPLEE